jgi:pimeloyl-ACP methyl ester carboxylesterase
MTGAYAHLDGSDLFYGDTGSGPAVVLLHGGMLTPELSYGSLLPALARTHRVITPELQGHGHTADTARPISFGALADDVTGLLGHLGIDRADLVGYSLGGMVALDLVTRRPDLVDRLVLLAAPQRPEGYLPPEELGPELMPTEEDGRQWEAAYRAAAPDPEGFSPFLAKLSAVVAVGQEWSDDQLRAITSPTLIMVGDRDFMSVEHGVAMVGLIPDAQLAVLPGTTHVGISRRPDLLTAIIAPFLARAGPEA